MDLIAGLLPTLVPVFLLYLLRVAAVVMLIPVVGDVSVPRPVKVGIAVVLALSIFMAREGLDARLPEGGLLLSAMREVGVGLWMGFLVRQLFVAGQMGGALLGFEIGFSFAGMVDPTTQSPTSPLGILYQTTAALLFLMADAHLHLFRTLAMSFDRIPLGGLEMDWFLPAITGLAGLTTVTFSFALAIIAPVFVVSVLVTVSVSILARLAQGLNVIEFGFPVRILVSLGLIWVSLPLAAPTLKRMFALMNELLVRGLGG